MSNAITEPATETASTTVATPAAAQPALTKELLADVREHASALDRGDADARRTLPALGAAGLLDLGAPTNAGGALSAQVDVLRGLAAECMSTAFGVWAHRMTIEYLTLADTPYAQEWLPRLRAGEVPGVTGMASAFRDLAGCGSLELTARRVEGGWVVDGPIRWASNLYEDALLVTTARAETGEKLVFATPLTAPGITAGNRFGLLGLGSTASSFMTLEGLHIADEQVLTTQTETFLSTLRPTFLTLQTALCLGLARTSLTQARASLVGVNQVFAQEVDTLTGRLELAEASLADYATKVASGEAPSRRQLLSLRLAGAELATSAATIEVKTAGGKGYASGTPASRRFRESAFIPVQSPSEAQLRWELSTLA